jgi:antitoxin Phd
MADVGRWKLEDAKARLSEVVRRANSAGPQRVTVRGEERAVILSAKDFDRLRRAPERLPLVTFMESLHVDGLDLDRDNDRGRDMDLGLA